VSDGRARLALVVALLAAAAGRAGAQHEAHVPAAPNERPAIGLGASAIGVFTQVDHGPLGRRYREGYVTQPVLMAMLGGRRVFTQVTFDFEGLTLARGELNLGGHGEGYVDRRHPHTYLHELLTGTSGAFGATAVSITAGKGFAPFGTDDPMMRPFEKYPVNHHLSQILERLVAIGAVRRGPLVVEGAVFNGDEPIGAGTAPKVSRFGDSWSARLTALPMRDLEVSASYASVQSPEHRDGLGLDQRKVNLAARYERPVDGVGRRPGVTYALVEWAKTVDYHDGRKAFDYASTLAEVAGWAGVAEVAVRLERTTRPEEERLANVFRNPRPASDLSISGITRWDIATVDVRRTVAVTRRIALTPFVEASWLEAKDVLRPSVFDPAAFYGRQRNWSLSVGARVDVGHRHARMGRYGVAVGAQGHSMR
jgi:hypothetical protein